MEKIIDKVVIALGCAASLLVVELTTGFIVCMLVVLSISALLEIPVLDKRPAIALLTLPLVATLFFSTLVFWIPLMAYDCLRSRHLLLKVVWILPLIVALVDLGIIVMIYVIALSLIACALSLKTQTIERERHAHMMLRDEARELSLALVSKNRELESKQDFEVRLAMLDERARIAREIHDNVGHLLTRSVLQVEAAQVVHGEDERFRIELEQIATTLHEAFDTVQSSVHDLHEESFDLATQIYAIERDCPIGIQIECDVDSAPEAVAYCMIALVKEAISNTIKHSDSSKIAVGLFEHPAIWQLEIKDNGSKDPFKKGDQTGARDAFAKLSDIDLARGGLGLRSMQERIRAFGGIFRIDYDQGFRIFATIPKTSGDLMRDGAGDRSLAL